MYYSPRCNSFLQHWQQSGSPRLLCRSHYRSKSVSRLQQRPIDRSYWINITIILSHLNQHRCPDTLPFVSLNHTHRTIHNMKRFENKYTHVHARPREIVTVFPHWFVISDFSRCPLAMLFCHSKSNILRKIKRYFIDFLSIDHNDFTSHVRTFLIQGDQQTILRISFYLSAVVGSRCTIAGHFDQSFN